MTKPPATLSAVLPKAGLFQFSWLEIHQALGWGCQNARNGIRAALTLIFSSSDHAAGTPCSHDARARAIAWLVSEGGSNDTEAPPAQMVVDVLTERLEVANSRQNDPAAVARDVLSRLALQHPVRPLG